MKFKKRINIGRLEIMVKNTIGVSKGGYLHINLLFLGIGSNGFGLIILGILFSFALKEKL